MLAFIPRASVAVFKALTLATGIFALASKTVNAASFDCAKARPGIEQAICLDAALSSLDDKMVVLYRKAIKATNDPMVLRQSQRDWLRLVRNRCANLGCLKSAYEDRIAALSEGRATESSAEVSGVGPIASLPDGITYIPPSVDYEPHAGWLRQSQAIENSLAMVRSVAPQATLPLVAAYQCSSNRSDPNRAAYYRSRENLVVVCYELVGQLNNYYLEQAKRFNSTREIDAMRLYMALQFTVLHEIGHALLHRQRALGSLGPEEVEADNFASTLLLLSRATDEQVREAVLSIWGLTNTFGMKDANGWQDYGDEHALPQQRFASFACLAIGRAPSLGQWLEQASVLPMRRAARCPMEWERVSFGLRTLLRNVR